MNQNEGGESVDTEDFTYEGWFTRLAYWTRPGVLIALAVALYVFVLLLASGLLIKR